MKRPFKDSKKKDRVSFLNDFTHNFYKVCNRTDLVSESYRLP
ncbi:hypothetical protein [Paenibacillus sp. PL91]|nr:hypothetical protein [Paenibacillus sp. PL91]